MLLNFVEFALFVIISIAIYPFLVNLLRERRLNGTRRARLNAGQFRALSDGVTHFEWAGPAEGPVLVLVHGFSSPFFIWDHNFRALAEAGFRVLRYDLYGRGYSDRPWKRYTAALFDRQLIELLDVEGVTGPVNLVGLSMGGGIALNFAVEHPERVSRIALIAPVSFNEPVRFARVLRLPGVGDWLIAALGRRVFLKSIPVMLGNDPEAIQAFRREYARQFQYGGCVRALLSTLRHGPIARLDAVYERASRLKLHGLLLWGTADRVLPFSLHERVLERLPHFTFHAIQDGGHCLNYQRPAEVNAALLDFLRQTDARAL